MGVRERLLRRAGALVCAVVMAAGTAGAGAERNSRSEAERSAAQDPPKTRVVTRLVEVSVVVRDKSGAPVRGLKAEDFELTDSGKKQAVEFFEETKPVTGAVAKASAPKRAGRILAVEVEPDVFTNRGLGKREIEVAEKVEAGSEGTLVALLLDAMNTPGLEQQVAIKQAAAFLEKVQPNDRIGLFGLGMELRLLHDFTSDTAPLLKALAAYRAEASTLQAGSSPRGAQAKIEAQAAEDEKVVAEALPLELGMATDDWIKAAIQARSDAMTGMRVRRTLEAIETIAKLAAPHRGRKSLVWISASFPIAIGLDRIPNPTIVTSMNRETYSREMERTTRAVNGANLAIYTIHTGGVEGLQGDVRPASGTITMSQREQTPFNSAKMDEDHSIDSMRTMSEKTGGKSYYRTNDFVKAIQNAVEDAKDGYTLGFYPDHGKWDGSFRPIRVRVNRPGTEVRFRQGYFAIEKVEGASGAAVAAKAPATKARSAEGDLQAAAAGEDDATGVLFTVRVIEPEEGDESLRLVVTLDADTLAYEMQGGVRSGKFEVMVATMGAAGEMLQGVGERMEARLDEEQFETVKEQGLRINRQVKKTAGVEMVRVVVREPKSGMIGSVTVPVGKYFGEMGQ